MTRQQGDVLLSLAQGRNKERNHVKTVKEILAEVAFGNFFFQIFVGGSDHTNVHGNGFVAAHWSEALLFQSAQHLGLGFQAHVAYLIKEEGSAAGFLELALFVVGGTVERAFQVTEQLVFPQALSMDGMGHEFFARTRPAINQHTTISRGHETDLLAQRFHWNAVAYDHTLELELLLEVPIFLAESLCLDCVLNEDESLVERQRLFQKIVCAELG